LPGFWKSMLRLTELRLPLDHPPEALRAAVLARLGLDEDALLDLTVFRRGHDARNPRAISWVYTLDLALRDEAGVLARHAGDARLRPAPDTTYEFVARAPEGTPRPVVIGTGPCGLLAALVLAQMGFRPIILERGKLVRERTKDTWGLWRRGVLVPESNVQFGEGGAGTFSDGKLYSQIKDPRHYGRKVLAEFVKAGAPESRASVPRSSGWAANTASAARWWTCCWMRRGRCRAWRWKAARWCRLARWCWPSATARGTVSGCCVIVASIWKPSPSASASASSIRRE
jgi:hypothetical protein